MIIHTSLQKKLQLSVLIQRVFTSRTDSWT